LVNHCKAIENDEERNIMARAIVDVMGNLQPHLRDVPDFQHKLWDQLFIMSNYQLDADSPYPKPSQEELKSKPQKLDYPKSISKYRFYGNNIQIMIDTAISWEDGELKDALILTIANHMKKSYLNWNKDTVDDSSILEHLQELSKGKLKFPFENSELSESKNLLRKQANNKFNDKGSKPKKIFKKK
jgi:hypothetical protein